MTSIDIKETILDKDSYFNIKRFKIGSIGSDIALKTIDSSNTGKEIVSRYNPEFNKSKFVFEKSKVIKNFNILKDLIDKGNQKKIDSFFGRQAWLSEEPFFIHMTFNFNPYDSIKSLEELSSFLTFYHRYSKTILCVPNILRATNPYTEEKSQKEVEIIDLDGYKRFVNECYDFLHSKNNKPIFVPISLKFTPSQIENLVTYYLGKEYFYFWIDMECKPISEYFEALIMQINDLITKKGRYGDCLIYITNMKREIITHKKKDNSPSSDILSSLAGANLVGSNREPPRNMKNAKPLTNQDKQHKARLFDQSSYYYVKRPDLNINKKENVTENSIRLAREFDNQKKFFLDHLKIEPYIKEKQMIQDHKEILTSFFKGRKVQFPF
ncbi:MAG: hypothetical protein AABX23_00230 [Nanoarchaeota archaeon]